jgi:hypothetical protein
MNKLVVVRLNRQLLEGDYQTITEIGVAGSASEIEIQGSLPALSQDFLEEIEEWQNAFLRLGFNSRLKVKKIPTNHRDLNYPPQSPKGIQQSKDPIGKIEKLASSLKLKFHQWLDSEGFRNTLKRINSANSFSDNIQIIICTNDAKIYSLPWNSWHFLELFQNASISFSSSSESYVPSTSRQPGRLEGLKVLAIMGDNEGIDLDRDLAVLENCDNSDIFVRPLLQPSSETLRSELERGCWDIVFFSGHSETINGKGILYLGNGESIFLSELRDSLEKAITEGLKLAIFNSCDGIGLAKDIQNLQIPQTIVMREPIPDNVAHIFLTSYIDGIRQIEIDSPLYLAERYARYKVKDSLICADWLPMIFQNHKVPSPIKGILRESRKSDYSRPDPYEDIRKTLKITLEAKPKACKVIQPISKGSAGEIQYSGALWKAQIIPVSTHNTNDTIFFPGDKVCAVARRGNLYYVTSPQVLRDKHSLNEIKKLVDNDWRRGEPKKKIEISGSKVNLMAFLFISLIGIFAISYLINSSGAGDLGVVSPLEALESEPIDTSR